MYCKWRNLLNINQIVGFLEHILFQFNENSCCNTLVFHNPPFLFACLKFGSMFDEKLHKKLEIENLC